jgi:hypothetical protein
MLISHIDDIVEPVPNSKLALYSTEELQAEANEVQATIDDLRALTSDLTETLNDYAERLEALDDEVCERADAEQEAKAEEEADEEEVA